MPKISVLMPVYNAEDYLAEAIDSVLTQTFTDWELLIGDDGSTDNTESIVMSYSDSRIKYYKNTENRGHTYTKYTLLDKSSGKYIAFLDADDFALPERFKIQSDFFDQNPEYGLCGTWGTMIDPKGHKIKKMTFINNHEYIRCSLLFNTSFLQSSIMVKRDLMKEWYYDEEILLVEDFNFECLVSRQCKVDNITKELVKYRWHSTNISNTKADILKNLNKKIYKRELSLLQIDASEHELDIHNAIRDKSTLEITNKQFLSDARSWLKKLVKANRKHRVFNHNIFKATVCFRWIFACKERKQYLNMLLIPVSLNPVSLYKLLRMIFKRL